MKVDEGKRISMIIDRQLYQAIEEWRRHQPDLPSKSEAIRRLLRKALLS
jgi:metal-responsive CopG/Arc/MetJ family transcriptional regulator